MHVSRYSLVFSYHIGEIGGGSLKDIGLATSGFDTLLLGFGKFYNVAVQGILDSMVSIDNNQDP